MRPTSAGYGGNRGPLDLPTTLAREVELVSADLTGATGPIHLVGHSYGGAIAFKLATDSTFANRVRSLTLIEPVLPTLLCDNAADRRLHDRFASLGQAVYLDLWNGAFMEAIDRFTAFWIGSQSNEPLPAKARLRMIEQVERLSFDFMAVLAEENVSAAAARISVPTLLVAGGLSPYLTQRIVYRLASIIPGANTRHFPCRRPHAADLACRANQSRDCGAYRSGRSVGNDSARVSGHHTAEPRSGRMTRQPQLGLASIGCL